MDPIWLTFLSAVLVAIIGGIFSYYSSKVTAKGTHDTLVSELDKHNAVQDERMSNVYREMTDLKNELKRHNDAFDKIPKIEERLDIIINENLKQQKEDHDTLLTVKRDLKTAFFKLNELRKGDDGK